MLFNVKGNYLQRAVMKLYLKPNDSQTFTIFFPFEKLFLIKCKSVMIVLFKLLITSIKHDCQY